MAEDKQNSNGTGGESASNPVDASFDVSGEIKKLQEQAEKYKNDFLYLRAEFDNYRRNMIKDRADLIKYGAEKLSRDLLPILDNFERALQTKVTTDTFTVFRQGVEMTATELRNALQKNGIEEVGGSEGQAFNPALHEALSSEASTEVPAGHVLRVFQKGYKMYDKLIRPAQVVVAKKAGE